ncbi:MAG TPA: DUF6702 family protein [Gemmatimonadales bacterium]
MVIPAGSLLLGILAAGPGAAPSAPPHPVHVSVTELLSQGARATVRIRVFAEDFPPGANDTEARRYVARHLTLAQATGKPVSLTWVRTWLEGELRYVELSAAIPNGFGGHRLVNTLLFERFEDQVNVVQVREGGGGGRRRATLIFTHGQAAQVIR